MSKVDINYEMVIQQQRDEDEQRQREIEQTEQTAGESFSTEPTTTWVTGRGCTEEEAERDARSQLTPKQNGTILQRKVTKEKTKTYTCHGDGALERSRRMVRSLTKDHCVVIEASELPVRKFIHLVRARSLRGAKAAVKNDSQRGIRDPDDPKQVYYFVEVKNVCASTVLGGYLKRFAWWLLGRTLYQVELETTTRIRIVYVPAVRVSLLVQRPS